jgi:hypothetical protein
MLRKRTQHDRLGTAETRRHSTRATLSEPPSCFPAEEMHEWGTKLKLGVAEQEQGFPRRALRRRELPTLCIEEGRENRAKMGTILGAE